MRPRCPSPRGFRRYSRRRPLDKPPTAGVDCQTGRRAPLPPGRCSVNRDEVLARVRTDGVRLVRFLYCDNANVVRGKAAHAGALRDFVDAGIGLTVAMQGFCLTEHLAADSALGPVGEVRLVPDPETYAQLPYTPDEARMLCDMVTLEGEPWEHCPRTFLKRMAARAADDGLTARAAFEYEFYLA